MDPESSTNAPGPSHTVTDATCLACGCLCDDIDLTVTGGRIVEALRACERGRSWFLADRSPEARPEATVEGRAVPPAEAIARAAAILAGARAPIILGLSGSSVETAAAAVALADRIGAVVEPSHAGQAEPSLRAFQKVGKVSATLGEVKNRADVVVFWGVDPVVTHPRHLERYSVDPPGRFVPEGRSGRVVMVADSSPSATSARADLFLPIRSDLQYEALVALRAIVLKIDLDPGALARSAGVAPDLLLAFADRLTRARYGAFFHGPGLGDATTVEAAFCLVRDLNNARSRFVALPVGGPGNPAGVEAVLAWQTGYPLRVDLSSSIPCDRPGEDATTLLGRGEVDAALIVADGVASVGSAETRDRLAGIPTVVIAPDATDPLGCATVGLSSATTGIDAGGTVVRSDGISLPLRPSRASERPTDRDWIVAISAQILSDARRTMAS